MKRKHLKKIESNMQNLDQEVDWEDFDVSNLEGI
jgi:hypothetical protein